MALFDRFRLAEHDRADRVLFEVQREPDGTTVELEDLVDRDVGQPGDLGDAVPDLEDPADLALLERGRERRDVLAQGRGDLVGVDGELRPQICSFNWSSR